MQAGYANKPRPMKTLASENGNSRCAAPINRTHAVPVIKIASADSVLTADKS